MPETGTFEDNRKQNQRWESTTDMLVHGKKPDPEREKKMLADLQRARQERAQGYRERALKILPHVCASCGREFSGKKLRELTVHHRDSNYKNNPPDGSNWEMLCLYCHDYEHERHVATPGARPVEDKQPGPSIFSPFENLDLLLAPETLVNDEDTKADNAEDSESGDNTDQ